MRRRLRWLLGAMLSMLALAAHAQPLTLVLDNQSSVDLVGFYASPTGVDDWGANRLGEVPLPAGQSRAIEFGGDATRCVQDLQFLSSGGHSMGRAQVNLCLTQRFTLND